jgi:hypothetical protein
VTIDYRQASEKEIDTLEISQDRATIAAILIAAILIAAILIAAILNDLRAIAIVHGLRAWPVKTGG